GTQAATTPLNITKHSLSRTSYSFYGCKFGANHPQDDEPGAFSVSQPSTDVTAWGRVWGRTRGTPRSSNDAEAGCERRGSGEVGCGRVRRRSRSVFKLWRGFRA